MTIVAHIYIHVAGAIFLAIVRLMQGDQLRPLPQPFFDPFSSLRFVSLKLLAIVACDVTNSHEAAKTTRPTGRSPEQEVSKYVYRTCWLERRS